MKAQDIQNFFKLIHSGNMEGVTDMYDRFPGLIDSEMQEFCTLDPAYVNYKESKNTDMFKFVLEKFNNGLAIAKLFFRAIDNHDFEITELLFAKDNDDSFCFQLKTDNDTTGNGKQIPQYVIEKAIEKKGYEILYQLLKCERIVPVNVIAIFFNICKSNNIKLEKKVTDNLSEIALNLASNKMLRIIDNFKLNVLHPWTIKIEKGDNEHWTTVAARILSEINKRERTR